ncbi:major facilitator superfamily domain-containing protein [Hypoxylon crocopeplum]|nr:major facilitator superfamily domain-containing protein [Hypoxylon crocopeplum]
MIAKELHNTAVVDADKTRDPQLDVPSGDTDVEVAEQRPFDDSDESIYDRFANRRKVLICVVLVLCGILAPIATTGSLTAVPEIAKSFHTTGSIINISNGLYTGAMGISAFVWGVISSLGGRKVVLLSSVVSFFLFSLGCALSPNLAAFFTFRALSGFSGTGLLVCGPAVIGDLYKPTERATALAWIMSGTLIGPALGPLIGGVIVTYSSWRNIYWFQTAMSGLASALAIGFIPETAHQRGWDSMPKDKRIGGTLAALNPLRLLVLFSKIDLLLVALASSSLLWNMYGFFTPIVYVINPRLHFTTPLQSGLFYLAPGSGYLLATFFGGRYADRTVKKWILRRDGERRPEDRLRAVVPWMGLGTPVCMLIYGWCLEYNRGGIPLLVIIMFIQGFTQLMIFPALNTYCLDVMPSRSTEVLGGNFLIRYIFAAAGTSLALPAINGIGIGWFCTISTIFILVTFGGLLLVIHHKVPRFGRMKQSVGKVGKGG